MSGPGYDQTPEGAEYLEERTATLQKLAEVEANYVENLNTLVELFLLPLREAVLSMQPILTQDEIRTIFSTVEVILSLNSKLYNDLKVRHAKWPDEQIIGLVFLEMAPYLKLYTQYIQNFNVAVTTMSECSRRQLAFASFLETCQANVRCEGQTIFAFLLMPLRQILFYLKSLEDLLQNTHDNHEDYDNILRAMGKIRNIALNIGEKLKEAESLEQVWVLQQSMRGGMGSLLEPHRAIIRAGFLKKQGKLNLKTCWFILFNDIFICTIPIEGSTTRYKYNFRWRLPLAGCTVEDIADDTPEGQAGGGHGFRVNSLRKNYFLYAFSEPEKEEWMQDLRKYIVECSRKKQSAAGNLGADGDERGSAMSVGNFLVKKAAAQEDDEESSLIGGGPKEDDGRPKWSIKYPPKLDDRFKNFDNSLMNLCQRLKKPGTIRFSMAITALFSTELILSIPFMCFMCSADGLGGEMTWMATITTLVPAFLKRTIWRKRPCFEGQPPRAKKVPHWLAPDTLQSFPCQTTCNAVMVCFVAGYIRKYYDPNLPLSWWMPLVPLFLIIPAVFARINLGLCYPTDCISGAVLGFILTWPVATFYKRDLMGCPSCAFNACYSLEPTGGALGTLEGVNIPVLIIFPLVCIPVLCICLMRPIEFFTRFHTFLGIIVPLLVFFLAYLCPPLSPSGLSLEEPIFRPWGLLLGAGILALVTVVSKLSQRGARGAFIPRLIGFCIIYALIFIGGGIWRLTYTRDESFLAGHGKPPAPCTMPHC